MRDDSEVGRGRRRFIRDLGMLSFAGASGLASAQVRVEPPPETTRIRIPRVSTTCRGPEWVAEGLLRAEGFTEIEYVPTKTTRELEISLASGMADIGGHFAAPVILRIEEGDPVVVVGGEHVGCFELLGTDRIRAIRDLKGRTVAVPAGETAPYAFLAAMAAYVGLNPRQDIKWVYHSAADSMNLLAQGKIDAYLGFPPNTQEFRAKKIGRVVMSSATDRPWAHYFCCLLVGNREFVRKNPVATKRAIRAILKAADYCAVEPEKVARHIVSRGFANNYDYTVQALRDIPYGKWREFDPEDTLRFYSLRLHEVGMIKSNPQKIISQSANWRFHNELRRELKA